MSAHRGYSAAVAIYQRPLRRLEPQYCSGCGLALREVEPTAAGRRRKECAGCGRVWREWALPPWKEVSA